MNKTSLFLQYIDAKEYDKAAELIKQGLRDAQVMDPRDDYTYGPEADVLAYTMIKDRGIQGFINFHEDLLHLFIDELEKEWGHLHKGHFYMRLGLAYLAQDVDRAYSYLEKGYQEDLLICQTFQTAGKVEDGAIRARSSPNYVTLVVIERSKPSYFRSQLERRLYFEGLAHIHMEVFWERKPADIYPVIQAIRQLVPAKSREFILQSYEDLSTMHGQNPGTVMPAVVCSFIRKLVLSLMHKSAKVDIDLNHLAELDLERLINLAADAQLFPDQSILTCYKMAAILAKELDLVNEENFAHPTDPITRSQIGYGLKSLLDVTLVEWSR